MELKLGIEVIESYKRLSYKVWYALAEYVDNSTQSYTNNKEVMDARYAEESSGLTVKIEYKNDKTNGFIQIEDNSIGMDQDDLEKALIVGLKPTNANGRSKYGLGMKTASFWFGDRWEIKTKKYGSAKEYHVTADLDELLAQAQGQRATPSLASGGEIEHHPLDEKNKLNLEIKDGLDLNTHYTIIKITKLNRTIAPKTASKTKDYLRSIYRCDLQTGMLTLLFQNEPLKWNSREFLDRLLKDDQGIPYLIKFDFEVNEKHVEGWAGVLETGGRRDGGFSVLQSNRVIQGWPVGYKPESLFGDQEGGTNNLVNQRLTGELHLDGFQVSHTKDEILFEDDEEELLNQKLFSKLADLKRAAEKYRKPEEIDSVENIDFTGIVQGLFVKMQNTRLSTLVRSSAVLPTPVIHVSNEEVIDRAISSEVRETYRTQLAGINITVILNDTASIYDPYYLVRSRAQADSIVIVINRQHHHWKTLTSTELIYYFIKHCIYDGLAEWKAYYQADDLDPDTIKFIKDTYLRIDFTME